MKILFFAVAAEIRLGAARAGEIFLLFSCFIIYTTII